MASPTTNTPGDSQPTGTPGAFLMYKQQRATADNSNQQPEEVFNRLNKMYHR
jgi:hypothetical protein